jgi:hypothetical protein
MEKILTQEEIGALFLSTQQGKAKQKISQILIFGQQARSAKTRSEPSRPFWKPGIFTRSRNRVQQFHRTANTRKARLS